jgi:hypothetical protein
LQISDVLGAVNNFQKIGSYMLCKMANYRDVFLGGTCNGSEWRNELIAKLDNVTYFDPVKSDGIWTEEDERIENLYKETCKYALYVITPKMIGFYNIAEVTDSSHRKPGKTIFCILDEDDEKSFNDTQKKSLKVVERLLLINKTIVKRSLDEVADFLKNV